MDDVQMDGRFVKSNRTKAASLKETTDTSAAKGFEGALTSDIAKAAGCAEGTLFLHFKNKRGLLLAVMQEFYAGLMAASNLILQTTDDSYEQLVALLRYYVAELAQKWSIIRLFSNYSRSTDGEASREFTKLNRKYTNLYVAIFDRLKKEKVLRAEVDSRHLRDILFGSIEHFAIGNFGKSPRFSLGDYIDRTLDILFHGAAHPGDNLFTDGDETDRKLDEILVLLKAREAG